MSSSEQGKDIGSSGSLSGEDEVEGHALRSGRATDDHDDADGHMPRLSGRVTADADDAEGHGFRGNATDEGDDAEDDADGHGVRVRF